MEMLWEADQGRSFAEKDSWNHYDELPDEDIPDEEEVLKDEKALAAFIRS
jgi:hypothetical protein